jgi:hypothetical protein
VGVDGGSGWGSGRANSCAGKDEDGNEIPIDPKRQNEEADKIVKAIRKQRTRHTGKLRQASFKDKQDKD